jgi:hypothetical protein
MAALEAQAQAKLARSEDLARQVQDLIARELADGRVRAGEIHALQQQAQVLKWEAQHLRAKINRLQNPWY